MTQPTENIYLIYPVSHEPVHFDHLGGEQHGALAKTANSVVKEIKIDQISTSLSAQAGQLAAAIGKSFSGELGDYSLEEISLSLDVTAEGKIAIATGGFQGSLSLVLKRKRDKNG